MTELTSHERKKLKRQAREEKLQSAEKERKARKTKKLLLYTIPIAILLTVIIMLIYTRGESYQVDTSLPSTVIHWHSDIAIEICGSRIPIPNPYPEHNQAASSSLPSIHTHDDGKIHMEGLFTKKENLQLGRFFENLGLVFNSVQITEYKNGNACNNGKENEVKMFVNGEENIEFDKFQLKDGDSILIRYE